MTTLVTVPSAIQLCGRSAMAIPNAWDEQKTIYVVLDIPSYFLEANGPGVCVVDERSTSQAISMQHTANYLTHRTGDISAYSDPEIFPLCTGGICVLSYKTVNDKFVGIRQSHILTGDTSAELSRRLVIYKLNYRPQYDPLVSKRTRQAHGYTASCFVYNAESALRSHDWMVLGQQMEKDWRYLNDIEGASVNYNTLQERMYADARVAGAYGCSWQNDCLVCIVPLEKVDDVNAILNSEEYEKECFPVTPVQITNFGASVVYKSVGNGV